MPRVSIIIALEGIRSQKRHTCTFSDFGNFHGLGLCDSVRDEILLCEREPCQFLANHVSLRGSTHNRTTASIANYKRIILLISVLA